MVIGCYHTVNNLPASREPVGSPVGGTIGGGLGMESLMPEMKQIAERIAKLTKIHADVYGVLYEQDGFLCFGEK